MTAPFRTLQSADRPQIDELKVFISYSRRDALDFVDRLQPALTKHGVDAYVDREDIEKGAALLELPLDEHITNVIAAMQGIAAELGFPN